LPLAPADLHAAQDSTILITTAHDRSALVFECEVMVPANSHRITETSLGRLKEGNARFAAGASIRGALDPTRRAKVAANPRPFAAILGCADPRVPPNIVFDQSFGDLFVVRVAGNVVSPETLGSIELAADLFDMSLVVVLGHTQCGAVRAALDPDGAPSSEPSPAMRTITDRVEAAVSAFGADDPVSSNVRGAMRDLVEGSPRLRALTVDGSLAVVGARYSVETGVVDFFESGALK
jgi:carbonic anhydrase